MPRYIQIDNCNECPYKTHSGGFGNPAYKPICRKTGKVLPYTTAVSRGNLVAVLKEGIPDKCPLETLKF